MKNIAASVRQRLMNLAKARGVGFNRILVQYGIERVLYRLSKSEHSDKFVLKGAMLFVLWQGVQHRETRDMDLLGSGDNSLEAVNRIFQDICAQEVIDDGLSFEGVSVTAITAIQEYGGVSVKINARLEAARIVVNVDVGFGDKVTPKARSVDFPALLDFPSPRVKAYPRETVVAEKFQAMVALGERNTRMKDFFDILYLSSSFDLQGALLLEAIKGTFGRRNTPLPSTIPVALTDTFAIANEGMWTAFLKRSEQEHTVTFPVAVKRLRDFLEPALGAVKGGSFELYWDKGGPWKTSN